MAEKRKKHFHFNHRKSNCITIHSYRRLVMEGVERIVFCDPERMILRGSLFLVVEGKDLLLVELGNDNMEITGSIRSIVFQEQVP